MTRRDYEEIAQALKSVRPELQYDDARDQWRRCVFAVSKLMLERSAAFDQQLFHQNCGVGRD